MENKTFSSVVFHSTWDTVWKSSVLSWTTRFISTL